MDLLSQFLNALQGLQTVQYSELASSVIIVYDHFITFDQEVELIWKSGWSFGKCLFLLNRYYTIFCVIFNNYVIFGPEISASLIHVTIRFSAHTNVGVNVHSCSSWFRWQGVTGVTAFMLGELILQLRLYALYNLDKKVLALMGTVFVMAVAASSVIIGYALSQIDVVSLSLLGKTLCAPLNLQDITYFYAFWIPMLVSESILCSLAILRAVHGWRKRSTIAATGRALVRVLIRDSILYFLIMFIVYLVNLVVFLQNNVTYTESAISYAVCFSCVLGNRLCLNVRGMIWYDDDIQITGASSFGPSGEQLQMSFRSRTYQQWPSFVMVGQSSRVLSDFEMDELRSMRAEDQKFAEAE